MATAWPQLTSNHEPAADDDTLSTPAVDDLPIDLNLEEPLPPLLDNIPLVDPSIDTNPSFADGDVTAKNTPFFEPSFVEHEEVSEPPIPCIVITNLHHTINKSTVLKLFEECGEIVRCCMTIGAHTNEITILFSSLIAAFTAAAKYNGTMLHNQVIQVKQLKSIPPSLMEHHEHRKPMSTSLNNLFQKASAVEIHSFKMSGGSVGFNNDAEELVVTAHTKQLLDKFVCEVVNEYCQFMLPLSLTQYNNLMKIQDDGISQLQRLTSPFSTNPNVQIKSHQLKTEATLLFLGKRDAAQSAYDHLIGFISKEIMADRIMLDALKKLYPDFDVTFPKVSITFKDDKILLDGSLQDVVAARAEIETIIADIVVAPHSSALSPIMCYSLKKNWSTRKVNAVTINESGVLYICAANQDAFQYASNNICNPYNVTVSAPSNGFESLHFMKVQEVEQDYLVEITLKGNEAHICGFIQTDIDQAKTAFFKMAEKTKIIKRKLNCAEPIACYVHYTLFLKEQLKEDPFIKSLQMKISSEQGDVMIEGEEALLTQEEQKLISRCIPPNFTFKSISYESHDIKFGVQIKEDYLSNLRQYKFTSILSSHSSTEDTSKHRQKRHQSQKSASSQKGFTLILYSSSQKDLEHVYAAIKELKPHDVRIKLPIKAVEEVMRKKKSLEQKHKVRITCYTTHPTAVLIHGLEEEKSAACKSAIEGTAIVQQKIYINGYKANYLQKKCSEKIKAWMEECKKFSMPEQSDLSKNCYIFVSGKSEIVDCIKQQIETTLGGQQFHENIFSVECSEFFMWKKRWNIVVKELEQQYPVVIEIRESAGPNRQHSSKGQLVNFVIYGPSKADVLTCSTFIKEKENGTVANCIEESIPIPAHHGRLPNPGELAQQLQLNRLCIRLRFKGSNLVIIAPAAATNDMEQAKQKVLDFMKKTEIHEESIEISDDIICSIVSSKCESLLAKANELAKQSNVLINARIRNIPIVFRISGSPNDVDAVKRLITMIIEDVQQSIVKKSFSVASIVAPYLMTSKFNQHVEKYRSTHQVVVSWPKSGKENKVLKKENFQPTGCSGHVQLLIVHGNILHENVDAIVNAANEDLDHIGGLAKTISDAAGSKVQEESTRHVKQYGKVKAGSAVCLGPGQLSYKAIIHAVAPRWTGSVLDNLQVTSAISQCLMLADKHGFKSIAIPALGTGIFQVPDSVCADAAFKALSDYCKSKSITSTLTDVHLVIYNHRSSLNFLTSLKKFSLGTDATNQAVALHPSLLSAKPLVTSWSWQNDAQQYTPYDADVSHKITVCYQTNPSAPCTILINGSPYRIDFVRMKQVNVKTGYERSIKNVNNTEVQWYYKNDAQKWAPYSSQQSSQIEQWYQNDDEIVAERILQIEKHQYRFDFTNKHQINMHTRTIRDIKRIEESEGDDEGDKEGVVWQYHDDNKVFQPYTPNDSEQLEEWYQNQDESGRLKIGNHTYAFDFTKMTQRNVKIGTTRSIQRVSHAPTQEELVPEHLIHVHVHGPTDSVDEVILQLQSQLERCLKCEDIPINSSSKELEISLKQIARKHTVTVNFHKIGTKTTASLRGVHFRVKDCVTEMQKVMLKHMEQQQHHTAQSSVKFPDEWTPQTGTIEVFMVNNGSPEWNRVSAKFQSTMPDTTIKTIERIQNQYLWERYAQHKKMMADKNGSTGVNEMELFHGTRGNDPRKIYDSDEGFDMRYSAQGMWGQANYFAVNASYSDGYAHSSLVNGGRQMFLAKVLTGDSHSCSSNSRLRMPPEKSSYATATKKVKLNQMKYDTVCGTTGGSKVYMTYDNLKAYPAYLITY